MLVCVGNHPVGSLSTVVFAALTIAVSAALGGAGSNDNRDSLKCWLSESQECNVSTVFPALKELRFYSYLPSDRFNFNATMGDAQDCACFSLYSIYNVTHLTLAQRPANQTATVTALTLRNLADLVNLSNVNVLWLEGTGIYSLHRDFFKSFRRLERLTITNTSSGEGFVFDTEPLLPSLKDVDLTNNSFTYISNDSVCTLKKLTINASVQLAGNPLVCDCTLQPLYEWLQNGSGRDAVTDKNKLNCSSGGVVHMVTRTESEVFSKCVEIDVSKHLEAAYVVMSVCLAVLVVILLLVMWRKASSYLSFCLNRRSSYAAVSV